MESSNGSKAFDEIEKQRIKLVIWNGIKAFTNSLQIEHILESSSDIFRNDQYQISL
ncbi:hypothetical protein CWI39_0231p0010 [Hamiltosporidium magnivora]|uniref:Uncharacterized protein n=1 Tax=Hamiltosporidium magnivora TaxID=148818 RepID=A0A4Q9LIP4_9MICR|nr:hypothetical protein CWI39_0231p0010 [Hamiltosporidium magnivora]